MKRIDKKGMGLRLYLIFMGFTLTIIAVVFFIQLFNIKERLRSETLNSLKSITWNISSTYGTDAYYKAMRAAAYSGGYLIKTITEDGQELDRVEGVSLNGEWPPITLELETLIEELNQSQGYIDYSIKGTDAMWVVHAQVLASWDGMREIIFVAQSTEQEDAVIKSVVIYLVESAAVILVIAVWLAWIFTKRFLRPIQDITENTKRVARGDYSVTYNENTYTELNLLSGMLNRAVHEFADYEEIRRSLIANLSHDMRTPLTLIKAYAEMVLNLSGDNKYKREEHLKVIIDQSDKLSEFVNSSLQLARLQSNEQELIKRRFSLSQLVEEVIHSFKVIHGDSVDFETDIYDHVWINANKGMIEQVIFNMISNALKYSDKIIQVNLTYCGRKEVLFEVIDQGEGIPKEVLPDIWTKYYRVKPYTKDSSNTGVGLSIVKELLEKHEIQYGVESTVGVGSKFWFVANTVKKDTRD